MSRRLWQVMLWSVLGAGLLAVAYLLINTTFMPYDDEGYVLLTYRNFIAGGRLYDDVFSQYGPWPYLYHLLVTLGSSEAMTHTLGRNLTALHWTFCALLCGAITLRMTGKTAAAVFATLLSFGLLWQMSSEPSHPGSLIAAMLAAATLAIVRAHREEWWIALGTSVGLVAALLVLTKINIGLLFIAGAGTAALRLTAWPLRWRRPATILATVGLLAVPWGLMARKLEEPWVFIFAIQFTLGAAGLLWVTPVANFDRRVPPRAWAVALGVFVGTLIVEAGVIHARGTSLHALLQAVLIDPLRHPTSFMTGFTWRPIVGPVAVVCWLVTARAGWELRHKVEIGSFTRQCVITLRLAAIVVFILNAETWLTVMGVGRFITFCLPLLPVFLIPLHSSAYPEAQSWLPLRLWVACLALPQVLHAYPVAGSQMGWGTFLFLPVMVAGIHDLRQALARLLPKTERWAPRLGWTVLLLVGFGQLSLLAHTGWDRYRTSKPLGLPGAENVRGGDTIRLALRVLTLNAAIHADVLFSRPGMFSYNLWSGVPTPTAQNATHWFWLLDDSAQAAIIDRLSENPRSAIITSQQLEDYLKGIHVPMDGPLNSFIDSRYRSLFAAGYFNFMVPHASRAISFGRFELLVPSLESATVKFPALLQTNVALAGELTSVQLQSVQFPWSVHANYTPQNAHIVLEPITAQGESIGPAIELSRAQRVRGLFRLSIYAPAKPELNTELELVGLDPSGAVLSESALARDEH